MSSVDQSSNLLAEFASRLTGKDIDAGAGIMIVVAHPDDETIGIGSHPDRIGLSVEAGHVG